MNKPLASSAVFYRPELDWLRFLAAAIVLLHHVFQVYPGDPSLEDLSVSSAKWMVALTVGGAMGVDLFFLLSSFLITEIRPDRPIFCVLWKNIFRNLRLPSAHGNDFREPALWEGCKPSIC